MSSDDRFCRAREISAPLRTLIVDDEVGVLEYLQVFLTNEGIEAIKAETTDEALALYHKSDAMITDGSFPSGMPGEELVRHIHERWPAYPAFLLTGVYELDQIEAESGVSFAGLYRKPLRRRNEERLLGNLRAVHSDLVSNTEVQVNLAQDLWFAFESEAPALERQERLLEVKRRSKDSLLRSVAGKEEAYGRIARKLMFGILSLTVVPDSTRNLTQGEPRHAQALKLGLEMLSTDHLTERDIAFVDSVMIQSEVPSRVSLSPDHIPAFLGTMGQPT